MSESFGPVIPSPRQQAFDECAALCRRIMDEEDAAARNEPPSERGNIHLFALRWARYGTAKQILERIAALCSHD